MADMTSFNYAKPRMLVPDGRAVFLHDKVVTTSLATNDTMSVAMPAGIEVHAVDVTADDIDTTTNSLFRLGYLKLKSGDTLTADDDYFAAAGQTLLRAGGMLRLTFPPIKFEVDWILRLILNTGGTWQAGNVYFTVSGNMIGVAGNSSTGLGQVY